MSAKMKRLLKPDMYYSNIWNIDFEKLRRIGIKYLIIDVDSTIADAHSYNIDPRAKLILRKILDNGLMENACLVSNVIFGRKKFKRVEDMAEELQIPYVAAKIFNAKPKNLPFILGLKKMQATTDETAVIGDQLFTDILGGNRMGMLTILLKPLGKIHWTTTVSLLRFRERRFLKKMGIETDDLDKNKETGKENGV